MRLPEIRLPTQQESECSSMEWFSHIDGTCLDQLPTAILKLSVPTTFIDIDPVEFGKMFEHDMDYVKSIADRIDIITGWDLHFIKLTTRSPKDVYGDFGLTCSGKQAMHWMSCSGRIIDDTAMFCHLKTYQPKICVREPFLGINGFGTYEFRCFVKDRDLIAVTDYDKSKPTGGLKNVNFCKNMRSKINEYFKYKIKPEMDLENYVFDLAYTRDGLILIEINPYGLSDPCFLDSYTGVESFNGYIATEKEPSWPKT